MHPVQVAVLIHNHVAAGRDRSFRHEQLGAGGGQRRYFFRLCALERGAADGFSTVAHTPKFYKLNNHKASGLFFMPNFINFMLYIVA